ncbi:HAD family hydrolase [Dactylosporangium sp. CS-047395]|uniref:HAD family hydrolase n=1 Tax=Dactylosporangium sp. CS-047395 TaxID=3239936 RepID=UPI003D8B9263
MDAVPGPPWSPKVVIFDVFNTLVQPRTGHEETFALGLSRYGVAGVADALLRLQQLSEAFDHTPHSASRETYEQWARAALSRILPGIDVDDPAVIPALEQLHQAPMEPRPGVLALLDVLQRRGVRLAACSNWGWDLETDLAGCGLAERFDVLVTSARAGVRKPHPGIYRHVLTACACAPHEALFVGDSLTSDVEGPLAVGIPAVHLVHRGASAARWWIGSLADLPALLAAPA